MSWTHGELVEALGRYEQACIDAGMTEKSVHSYWDYASRFLRWRMGEYRPQGSTRPARRGTFRPASTSDLAEEAKEYVVDLESAGRQQAAIDTYFRHAMFFVRWLDGKFVPGGRLTGRIPER